MEIATPAPIDIQEFLSETDDDALGDLSQEAREAVRVQTGIMQRIFDTRYASTSDLREFIRLSEEMAVATEALKAQTAKYDDLFTALGGRLDQQRDSLRDTATEAIRAYMEAGPGSRPNPYAAGPPDPLAVDWQEEQPGMARARLETPAPSITYAWTQAKLPVANTYPIEALTPYFLLRLGDPLMDWANVYNVSTGAFNIPVISGVVTKKNGQVANSPGTPDGVNTAGRQAVVNVYEQEAAIPIQHVADMPNVRPQIISLCLQEYGAQIGVDSVAALGAAAAANGVPAGNRVNTGVANGLPTVANLPGKLSEAMSKVKAVYRMMSCWQVNESVEALLNQLYSTAGYAFDPNSGLRRPLGYPLVVNSHLADGNANGEFPLFFGNFYRALIIAPRLEYTVEEYRQTRPGAITFFGHGACGHALQDANGLALWNVGA